MRGVWWIWWLAWAPAAYADGWAGEWQVVGRPEVRAVAQDGDLLRVRAEWPGLGPVELRGGVVEGELRLRAATGARGMVQALAGSQAAAQVRLELRARVDESCAGAVVRVDWRRDGQVRWRERWRRAREASLETVTAPPGLCDPQAEGPLRWQVRVLGRPQVLELQVELAGADRDRRAFYGGRRLVTLALGELAVGEHTITWSGRDATPARRVALAGGYRLCLVGAAARLEAETRVAPPRAVLLDPSWPDRGPARLDGVQESLRAAGYAVQRWGGQPDTGQLFDLLRRSAVVWIRTHGNPKGFAVLRGRRVETFSAARLRGQLERDPQALRDLRAVLIYSCLVGAGGGAGLPQALLEAGADCVVSFDSAVLTLQHTPWQHELSRWIRAGDSLRVASRKAAFYADRVRWTLRDRGWRERQRARGVRPLSECLVFRAAPGVDPHGITLRPARYGRTDR